MVFSLRVGNQTPWRKHARNKGSYNKAFYKAAEKNSLFIPLFLLQYWRGNDNIGWVLPKPSGKAVDNEG